MMERQSGDFAPPYHVCIRSRPKELIDPVVFRLAIFVLAIFVNYYVVWSVAPAFGVGQRLRSVRRIWPALLGRALYLRRPTPPRR
jgi:hypothetical protein